MKSSKLVVKLYNYSFILLQNKNLYSKKFSNHLIKLHITLQLYLSIRIYMLITVKF